MPEPKEILMQLGYGEDDASLYLACLELGEVPAADIGKRAGMNRSTAYIHLKELEKQGIVSVVEKNGIQYFSAIDPRMLVDRSKNAIRQAEAFLPDLLAISGKISTERPRVQYYEGIEGVKVVLEDTLTAKETIRVFGNADLIVQNLPDYYPDYVKRRVAAGVRTKAILNEGKIGEAYKLNAKDELREVRLVPATFQMPNEIKIYGDTVAIMSHARPFGAVLIRNAAIAQTQKTIHDMAWEFAGLSRNTVAG